MLGGGTAISCSSSSTTSSLFLLFVFVQSLSRDILGWACSCRPSDFQYVTLLSAKTTSPSAKVD
jgi:hypothetical protein